MQIAAARPEYLNREAVPQERLDKEMEILKVQAMNEGKPEAIAEKIVMGRLGKFYGEICLVEQDFVKDPNVKISKLDLVLSFLSLDNLRATLNVSSFFL